MEHSIAHHLGVALPLLHEATEKPQTFSLPSSSFAFLPFLQQDVQGPTRSKLAAA
jgi:hypothetical protein